MVHPRHDELHNDSIQSCSFNVPTGVVPIVWRLNEISQLQLLYLWNKTNINMIHLKNVTYM